MSYILGDLVGTKYLNFFSFFLFFNTCSMYCGLVDCRYANEGVVGLSREFGKHLLRAFVSSVTQGVCRRLLLFHSVSTVKIYGA